MRFPLALPFLNDIGVAEKTGRDSPDDGWPMNRDRSETNRDIIVNTHSFVGSSDAVDQPLEEDLVEPRGEVPQAQDVNVPPSVKMIWDN